MAFDWAACRTVVTGGAGFLGTRVVERLRRAGAKHVFVPRSRTCDLRDPGNIARLFEETAPHRVIHLAAVVGGIGANAAHPGRFFHDNMLMGVQLIEAARRCGVEKFVCVGTVCAYPDKTPVPFREESLWEGYPEPTNAPYGVAKRALLTQLQAYRREYGLESAYLLPANLYGPGDHFDPGTSHVIPALLRRFVEAQEAGEPFVTVWGTGNPTREFLYVEDAAEAVLTAAGERQTPEPMNVGSGEEISIRALANLLKEMTGYAGEVRWDPSKPDGQARRCLDTTRIRRRLGWRAKTPLREGLRRTLEWYLENRPKP